jgi:hypothetical protein
MRLTAEATAAGSSLSSGLIVRSNLFNTSSPTPLYFFSRIVSSRNSLGQESPGMTF